MNLFMICKGIFVVYYERIEYNQKEKGEKSQKLSRRRKKCNMWFIQAGKF